MNEKTNACCQFPWGRFVGASVLYVIISQIIHTLAAFLTMKYYLLEEYFPVWSKIMMPKEGPPPATFYYYSLGFGLISAMLFVLVYWILKNGLPGKTLAKKGLIYGLLVCLVATIPGYLSMIMLINLPLALVISWAVECLVIYVIVGPLTAKIIK